MNGMHREIKLCIVLLEAEMILLRRACEVHHSEKPSERHLGWMEYKVFVNLAYSENKNKKYQRQFIPFTACSFRGSKDKDCIIFLVVVRLDI